MGTTRTHDRGRWLAILLVLAMAVVMLAAGPVDARSRDHHPPGHHPPADDGGAFTLTLLHHNDGESQLINGGSGLEDFGGVDRFVSLVNRLRHRALRSGSGTVLVSAGDNFLAGPEWNASLEKGVPYYDALAMSALPYDAVIIGNHDFDFGPDVLADFINSFVRRTPPFISANLDFGAEPALQALVDSGRIASSTVVYERGRAIGIVGATTPELNSISSPRGVVVDTDVAGAVQAEVDALTAAGVDIIILVSHLQSANNDIELIAELEDVDIAVAGGGDELLADEGDLLVPGDEEEVFGSYPLYADDANGVSVPVVTGPGSYLYVGALVASFDDDGNLIAVDDVASGPNRVSGVAPDGVKPAAVITEKVVEPVAAALEELATTVIGTSEVDLDGVRGNVRTVETNEGNLLADALMWQAAELAGSFGVAAPDVGLQNGGGIRNDSVIAAGDITLLDTFDIAPFGNFVTIVPDIDRAQFKEILENAVSRVEDVNGRFAQVSGFSFEYTLDGTAQEVDDDGNVLTAGDRVLNATLDDGTVIVSDGAVVDGDALTIATINFLASGGDQYPYRGAEFTQVGVTYQQALANYITDALGGTITAADYPEGGEGRITQS